MSRTVELSTEATAEAAEARAWYGGHSPELAGRFMEDLDGAIADIVEHPERWQTVRRQARRFRMHRFPYAVVYTFDDSRVRVIAIAHTKRRPGYWVGRI